jgi:hypothetical protein
MAIQLGHGVGLDKNNQAVIATSIDIFDTDGNNIGYCVSVSRNDTRNVQRIRHLNSADAGRIVEMSPSPSDTNLTVNGFALYNDADRRRGLLNRLPGSAAAQFATMDEQKENFTIKVREKHPSTGDETITYYHGCMLTGYTKPMNITTANVTETAMIAVSWVDTK